MREKLFTWHWWAVEDQQEGTDILSDFKKCVLLKPWGTICVTRVVELMGSFNGWTSAKSGYLDRTVALSTRCNSCKEAYPVPMEANLHLPEVGLCHHAFWSLPCYMVPIHFSYFQLHCLFMCVWCNAVCYGMYSVTSLSAHVVIHTLRKDEHKRRNDAICYSIKELMSSSYPLSFDCIRINLITKFWKRIH